MQSNVCSRNEPGKPKASVETFTQRKERTSTFPERLRAAPVSRSARPSTARILLLEAEDDTEEAMMMMVCCQRRCLIFICATSRYCADSSMDCCSSMVTKFLAAIFSEISSVLLKHYHRHSDVIQFLRARECENVEPNKI
jgi:hypothetical protein